MGIGPVPVTPLSRLSDNRMIPGRGVASRMPAPRNRGQTTVSLVARNRGQTTRVTVDRPQFPSIRPQSRLKPWSVPGIRNTTTVAVETVVCPRYPVAVAVETVVCPRCPAVSPVSGLWARSIHCSFSCSHAWSPCRVQPLLPPGCGTVMSAERRP
jgi:hypothetical protein